MHGVVKMALLSRKGGLWLVESVEIQLKKDTNNPDDRAIRNY
jgi:hypothetical protein